MARKVALLKSRNAKLYKKLGYSVEEATPEAVNSLMASVDKTQDSSGVIRTFAPKIEKVVVEVEKADNAKKENK